MNYISFYNTQMKNTDEDFFRHTKDERIYHEPTCTKKCVEEKPLNRRKMIPDRRIDLAAHPIPGTTQTCYCARKLSQPHRPSCKAATVAPAP